MEKMEELNHLNRFQEISAEPTITELLWSDPEPDSSGFRMSPRGAGFLFGEDTVQKFTRENEIKFVVRAHQLVREGPKEMFGGKLITVWSAPNYCYRCGNIASILEMDEGFEKEFKDFEANTSEKKFRVEKREVGEYFL